MRLHPLFAYVGRELRSLFRDFLVTDMSPRDALKSESPERSWQRLEVSRKRSHWVLGVMVASLVACFGKAVYIQCFNTDMHVR